MSEISKPANPQTADPDCERCRGGGCEWCHNTGRSIERRLHDADIAVMPDLGEEFVTGLPRELPFGAATFTIRVNRSDNAGKTQHIEFDGYGLLRELMADIETEADKRGWFEDTST